MSVDISSFITRTPGVVGGRASDEGTRVPVQSVAICYKQGDTPEEIVLKYERLSITQVYAALTYYHANRDEIEASIAEEAELYDRLAREDWQAKQSIEASKVYQELVDFIATGTTPESVIAFHPSEVTQERVSDLIYREKTTGLSDEEKAELDHYARLEHVMRMAKIRARQLMNS